MSQTLPADLYDPVLALQYTTYRFYENNSVLSKFARGDASAPITLNMNKVILSQGGTVVHAPVYKPNANLVTRRDLTSEADATPEKITTRDDKGVRISAKMLMSTTQSASWLSGQPQGALTNFFAKEANNRLSLYIRKYVLGVAKAAITNMTSSFGTKSVWSDSDKTKLSTGLLASIRALLGDSAEKISAGTGAGWVFRGESFNEDLTQFQLNQGVQGIADRAAAGMNPHTLGMDYCLADDAALLTAVGSGLGYDKYYSLLLGPGCIELDLIAINFQDLWVNPKAENVEYVLRGDADFELRVPGFQWDNTSGGTNPDLTAASLSTNWDPTYTDHREVLMAMGEHNATAS